LRAERLKPFGLTDDRRHRATARFFNSEVDAGQMVKADRSAIN